MTSEQTALSPAKQELLKRWKSAPGSGSTAVRPPRTPPGPAPLTFQQLRLWFLDRLVPGSPAYNIPAVLRLTGPLDTAVLRRALTELVERHEALRMTVSGSGEDAEPVQRISPRHSTVLTIEDVPDPAAADAVIDAEARSPFDLAAGPLYRFRLLRTTAEEHVLLLTWSHLIADGWSTALFTHELASLYRAFAAGLPSPLTSLPLTYTDYAVRQRETMQGAHLERLLAHWRKRLAGAPAVTELPTDRPRPAVQSFRGDWVPFTLPAELVARLRDLARATDTTFFMVVLAAFKTLLHRYNGQADLVVGTPVANRGRSDLEGVFGFFANTLAVRTDLSGDPTFRELLARVRTGTTEAYAHQELPFEKLVDDLGHDHRSTSHNPVFQVMYAHNNTPAPAVELDTGLSAAPLHGSTSSAKFDLWLSTVETEDGARGVLEFATDLFDRQTAERVVGHLANLLASAVSSPDLPLSGLAVLGEDERAQLVHGWNATGTAFPGSRLLHVLFEEQADRTPDAVAVTGAGGTLTYRELDEAAERIAACLRRCGAGPETVVAVAAERSPGLIAALLGVLKTGGAYLPLDPSYPAERLEFMLRDSGAAVLLVEDGLPGGGPRFAGKTVTIASALAEPPEPGRRIAAARPDNAAYVIYTSGSTGLPKGVVNTHRGIVNRLRWMQEAYRLTAADRVLQKTPSGFDVSVWEFFLPLATGARLVLAAPDGHRDNRRIAETIAEQRVTVVHFVPSMLRLFLAEDDIPDPASLRLVVCSGEALPYALQEAFAIRWPHLALENLYGPTEAAVDVTRWSCRPNDPRGIVPIGAPIANTRIHLLDDGMEPVPVGVPGELWIGGVQLARGYLGRPGLTAERFAPDPFAPEPGARLYRTGDLARRLPDGTVDFLGRRDHQVKLRGLRIEPGEIEAALRGEDVVDDAAVVVRRPTPRTMSSAADGTTDLVDDRQLIAYVVLDGPRARRAIGTGPQKDDGYVGEWAGVFDSTYDRGGAAEAGSEPGFDLSGWNSSYTGEPLPAADMRCWVDDTVRRIRALRPRRVLELGCGTGLLLFPLAPHVESYTGADVSRTGLDTIRRGLEGAPAHPVSLIHAPAHSPDLVEPGSVDTVIVNSVVQYFPDAGYLTEVLRQAVRYAAPGGRIFLGDLRDLGLLEALHASVETFRADEDTSIDWLRARVLQQVREERELAVDPELFCVLRDELPRIGRIEVQLKGGGYENELNRFRYDVILHLDTDRGDAAAADWLDWDSDAPALPTVRDALAAASASGRSLGVLGVPNPRTAAHVATAAALRAGEPQLAPVPAAPAGPDPESWRALGDEQGWPTEIRRSPGDRADRYDILFHAPQDRPPAAFAEAARATAGPVTTGLVNKPLDQRLTPELSVHLRSRLKERLPDYMVPSFFVVVPRLPLTPSGKCDHNALPGLTSGPRDDRADGAEPSTPEETLLAKVVSDVLGLDALGVHQNYFALGGDSIRGIQVVSRARREGLELELRDLFQHPTVAELAAAVTAREGRQRPEPSALDPALAGLDEADRQRAVELAGRPGLSDAYGLSPFQEHMLAHWAADPRPDHFLVQRVEILRGLLDTEAFAAAWRALAGRFPILRTRFVHGEGAAPLQVVHADGALPVRNEDWTGLGTAERDAALRGYLAQDKAEGLPPDRPGSMRLLTARTGDDSHVVVLSFSYLRVDGWSLGLFTEALLADYARRTGGAPPTVDEGPAYREFIGWVRTQGIRTDAESHWRRTLRDLPQTALAPTVPGNVPGYGTGLVRLDVRLPTSLTDDLLAAARTLRRTPNTLFQAAWAVLLAAYAQRDDVVFGAFVNGRPAEVDGIVVLRGPTMNMLPVRVRDITGGTFADAVDDLAGQALDLDAHAQTPPGDVARWAGRQDTGELFDNYVVFQNLDPAAFGSTAGVPAFFSRMAHPLRLDVFPGRNIGIALSYRREVLSDAGARRVLADLTGVLAAATAQPHCTVASLVSGVRAGAACLPGTPRLIVEGELAVSQLDESPVLGAEQ
ncbi:amino acid adenylation domain-containing protein [Streptomyces goshikiensis]|uniref:non-ribosomal peptide synthetase n=1 Tax=Streptomyces goshikiensis TaxID=1942 RepID=UPI00367A8B25